MFNSIVDKFTEIKNTPLDFCLNCFDKDKNILLDMLSKENFDINHITDFSRPYDIFVQLRTNNVNYELFNELNCSNIIEFKDDIKKLINKFPIPSIGSMRKNVRPRPNTAHVNNIANDSEISGKVKTILGQEAKLWQMELLIKPPKGGLPLKLHSDYGFWAGHALTTTETIPNTDYLNLAVVSVWIPLTNVNKENGTLQIVPKLFFPKAGIEYDKIKMGCQHQPTRIYLNMNVGECLFFNERLLHMSDNNQSSFQRPVLILRFTRPPTKRVKKKTH